MAATEDEWERLFRQRLENYESEPDEDALERILGGVKPPIGEKPAGGWRNRLGGSLALLGMLGILTFGIWEHWTSPTGKLIGSSAIAKFKPKNETTRTTFSTDGFKAGRVVSKIIPSEKRAKQRHARVEGVVKSLIKIPPIDKQLAIVRTPDNLARKPGLSESGKAITDKPVTNYKAVFNQEIVAKEKPYEADEINFTINQSKSTSLTSKEDAESIEPQLTFDPMASKTTRLLFPAVVLPAISSKSEIRAPVIEPERLAEKPSFFASLMPLYTFRQVTPTRRDDIVMEKIRPARSLSARTGWRAQFGAELPLSSRFGLRLGVAYQQLQQQLTYTARALRSDSSKVEWIDQQTVKLTPLYKSEERHVKSTWRYVAVSAEGRLQLNSGLIGLRHYIAAGGSVGYLISGRSKERWQPFLQASYGIERQLTETLSLQVEPGIVYNLSAINDNSRCFSVRPYSYGLVIGLHWRP